jgi:hypothetical protein
MGVEMLAWKIRSESSLDPLRSKRRWTKHSLKVRDPEQLRTSTADVIPRVPLMLKDISEVRGEHAFNEDRMGVEIAIPPRRGARKKQSNKEAVWM